MMIDFACKTIKIEDIIKCSLNLSKAELKVFRVFTSDFENSFTTDDISSKLNLNLSTVQKAVKKMHDRGILNKSQKNLEKGGYVFEYRIKDKEEVKQTILESVASWTKKVEDKICHW